jgi:hypothetical protein
VQAVDEAEEPSAGASWRMAEAGEAKDSQAGDGVKTLYMIYSTFD